MKRAIVDTALQELLYETLEIERLGQRLYAEAMRCAQDAEQRRIRREEAARAREQERFVVETMRELGLNPTRRTPVRRAVRRIADWLVSAMRIARRRGDRHRVQRIVEACIDVAGRREQIDWSAVDLGQLAASHPHRPRGSQVAQQGAAAAH